MHNSRDEIPKLRVSRIDTNMKTPPSKQLEKFDIQDTNNGSLNNYSLRAPTKRPNLFSTRRERTPTLFLVSLCFPSFSIFPFFPHPYADAPRLFDLLTESIPRVRTERDISTKLFRSTRAVSSFRLWAADFAASQLWASLCTEIWFSRLYRQKCRKYAVPACDNQVRKEDCTRAISLSRRCINESFRRRTFGSGRAVKALDAVAAVVSADYVLAGNVLFQRLHALFRHLIPHLQQALMYDYWGAAALWTFMSRREKLG